ncbi:hypothetical protein JCM16303_005560 [Sporobolomyces ruberrimus]
MLGGFLNSTSASPPPSPSSPPSPPSPLSTHPTSPSHPYLSLSPSNPFLIAFSTTILLSTSYLGYQRFGRRIRNVDELRIPQDLYPKRKYLKGIVTSVGDADNFRVWHRPVLRWYENPPKTRSELKGETIHVRLAGVDAPELAHFGKPAQPFSSEALDLLTTTLISRPVLVELYQKDRYNRVVGMCYVRRPWYSLPLPFKKDNVSELLLKAGLATVYTQGGAVYAGKFERFKELEEKAKKKKLGMWAMSSNKYESPAEYKKRTAGTS